MTTYLRKNHIIKLNFFKASSMLYHPRSGERQIKYRAIKMP